MAGFIRELERRNVFKVAVAYVIVAWLVVQLVNNLTPMMTVADWLPGTILIFLIVGFPIALLLSWAYELTPGGMKRTEEVDPDASITHNTGRNLDFIIIAALVLALGYFVYESRFAEETAVDEPQATETITEKSIAVLAFVAMSSGEDDGYFADGLTEELLNSLAQISDLKVAGRTSSFYYKGKDVPIPEIGETLGVAHVLEGSVRRSGNQLRITAQLIQASDGFHLWSETYDRTSEDIFAIQEDIAKQVTAALRVALLGEEAAALTAHGTENAEAQSLYLIAISKLRESDTFGSDPVLTAGHFAPARRALERAVELDPDYAEAWAALSRAYLALRVNVTAAEGEGLSYNEGNRLANEAADRALALAPELPEALFAKGIVMPWIVGASGGTDFGPARALMERALRLAPGNIDFLRWLAERLVKEDKDYETAIALYDRALAIDPLSILRLNRADTLRLAGRAVEARAEVLSVAAFYPDAPWKAGIAQLELDRGHLHHFILWIEDTAETMPAFAWASLGEVEKGLEIFRGFGGAGGDLDTLIEVGSYFFERDYQGLSDRLMEETGFTSQSTPRQIEEWKLYAAGFLRDWPAAIDHLDSWAGMCPPCFEIITGAPDGLTRLSRTGPTWQIRWAFRIVSMAYWSQMAGRSGEAESMRDWALEIAGWQSMKTPRWQQEMHIIRAFVQLGRGEQEQALAEMETAYDAGWRWLMGGKATGDFPGDLGWFEDNPMLDSIRDEPRFIAVIDAIKADNAAMLAELNAGLTLEDIMDEE